MKMGYEEVWNVLADLITELRNKGQHIPANVMNDLRSAKTMIQVFKADTTHIENIPRIEIYLENVEAQLISMAQEKAGSEFVAKWMEKLEEARRKVSEEKEESARFVPGLPRDKHWVRVQISEGTPQKEIEKLAKENNLSHKIQKDGYMLVYGDDENIKAFVKKMAAKFHRARR
jgi:hypothetical protein